MRWVEWSGAEWGVRYKYSIDCNDGRLAAATSPIETQTNTLPDLLINGRLYETHTYTYRQTDSNAVVSPRRARRRLVNKPPDLPRKNGKIPARPHDPRLFPGTIESHARYISSQTSNCAAALYIRSVYAYLDETAHIADASWGDITQRILVDWS